MSGYTDEALSRYEMADQTAPLLQKPFTPSTLTRRVRDLLRDALRIVDGA